ncbi:hypothetical protein BGZ63DRAFT_391043 [Mariannaea sp. PMI_226]|nr:hypothetical protein BGZ63DRAFT_391043 [Mariannaea sp. PMI_226]
MKRLVKNLVDEAVGAATSFASTPTQDNKYGGTPNGQNSYLRPSTPHGYSRPHQVQSQPPTSYAPPIPAPYYHPPSPAYHVPSPQPGQPHPYHVPSPQPGQPHPYYPPPPPGPQVAYQPPPPPPQQYQGQPPAWDYTQPTAHPQSQPVNAHSPYAAPSPTSSSQHPPAIPAHYYSPPPPSSTVYQPQYGVPSSHPQSHAPSPPTHLPVAPPHQTHYGPPPTHPSTFAPSQQTPYFPPPPGMMDPAPQESGITSPSPHETTPHAPVHSPAATYEHQNYVPPPPPPPPPAGPQSPQAAPFQRDANHSTQSSGMANYENNFAAPVSSQNTSPPKAETLSAASPADPLRHLAAQMNNLGLQSNVYPSPPPSHGLLTEDDRPQKPPPIRASGPPSEIIAYCPESRAVEYSLDWYQLPDLPKFLICTRCHADYIQNTTLAPQFQRISKPDGSASSCLFWYPHVKDNLWPQVVQRNDLSALRAYITKRQDVPACRGRVFSTGAEGGKWYGLTQPGIIDDFLACEACYHDHIEGTAFESRFSPYRKQGETEQWACDLCVPYISATVKKTSKNNEWESFVAAATHRLQLPECEGKMLPANTVNWFVLRQNIKKFRVCETCYLDKLALSRFSHHFEAQSSSSGLGGFLKDISQESACSLSSIPMIVAIDAAIEQRNFTTFWTAAEAIVRLVPCTENGIIRGNWWTINRCEALSVCEACYEGILKTTDVAQYFEPAKRDPAASILCSFCPASHRFGQFLNRFAETLDKGVITYFSDYVTKWAGVSPCTGVNDRKQTRWWGFTDVLCCEECYLGFVSDTSLANAMTVRGLYDERSQICQYWSPRMRKMWLEACNAGPMGSPESEAALDKFKAFGLRRLQVYIATIPQITYLEKMRLLKVQSAMHQGTLSIMYQGMDSMASLSGTTDGYLHGNSSLGWYATENGVTSAQMMNNMRTGLANANRPDDVMHIVQLKMMWAEVE